MAVKKNTGTAATTVDTKKSGKAMDAPVAVEPTKAEKVAKVDKHNHDLEHARNTKAAFPTSKIDTKVGGSQKKKEDLSQLEASIKANAAAKAAKGKKPGKAEKK
uniref:Uncharacterized protein n=1 Tax=Amphora coffeiformis TaxID=265554 RepID=A0A7S3L6U0_9STRA|eukprot:scaffold513_cov169-Amphora_coffeaeformis.AAC.3